jgi:TPR repeat protein
MNIPRLAIIAGLTGLLFVTAQSFADLASCAAASERQDWTRVLRECRPLAEQGVASSQFYLSSMYYLGKGVRQDYAEALKWLQLAARQSYAPAQYNLGVMYDKGRGVPQDFAEALKWYRLVPRADRRLTVPTGWG